MLDDYRRFKREEGNIRMAKIEMNAVFEDDLSRFLESLEILEPLKNGEMLCAFCGKEVNLNNFSSVFPQENDIKVCCDEWQCYNQLMIEGV
jgi:hypothetical protein